jgi:hypothetical protein
VAGPSPQITAISLLVQGVIFSFNAPTGDGKREFHVCKEIPGTTSPPDPAIHSTRDADYGWWS